MNKDINNAKQDLLQEIKYLCQEIEKTQSFSGLISLESRVHKMYQQFMVLKYLEEHSLPLESIQETVTISQSTIIEENTPLETMTIETVETPVEEVIATPVIEQPVVKESVAEPINYNSLPTYSRLAIDLNDKIGFVNQLFNKDTDAFNHAMMQLNEAQSLIESEKIIDKLSLQYNWYNKEEFVERLRRIVENRFL